MIYELTLFMTYAGQSTVNRWNYLSLDTPAAVTGSFALISAVGGVPPNPPGTTFAAGTMMKSIEALVSDNARFVALQAKAVYSVVDFYELPYVPTIPGDVAGPSLSPVAAFGFRTSRTRTDIRRGTKRFPGVTEADEGNMGILDASAVTRMNVVAAAMSAPVTYDDEGNTMTFSPIVVSKELRPVPGKTTEAYYYYETLEEQMDHVATSIAWQPYAQVRSQTSRQYGRGQ